jgi:hypothetical protein
MVHHHRDLAIGEAGTMKGFNGLLRMLSRAEHADDCRSVHHSHDCPPLLTG